MDWDEYYLSVCNTVSKNSKCLSRQIGAIIVRDKSIISTGYNGPAARMPHCGEERWAKDSVLRLVLMEMGYSMEDTPDDIKHTCPRRLLGYRSGEGLEWCQAVHAERSALLNAAKNGISTDLCTIYMNCPIPCSNCFRELINAGISEIVCTELKIYDDITKFFLKNSDIKVRTFNT